MNTEKFAFIKIEKQGKIPLHKKWNEGPAASPDAVARWEDDGFNIGVRTGEVSGIVVLDLDDTQTIPDYLPDTPTIRTGNGFHLYYKYRPGLKNSQLLIKQEHRQDIDLIKTDGGYCVYAGSTHPSGLTYDWISGQPDEMADFPEDILAPTDQDTGGLIDYMVSQVKNASEGTRNTTLNNAAFTISGTGDIEDDKIMQLLTDATDLPKREAASTIMSGIRAGRAKPLHRPVGRDDTKMEQAAQEQAAQDHPFTCLGYDSGVFYFYSKQAKQIIPLTASGLSKPTSLFSLAPLAYWYTLAPPAPPARIPNYAKIADLLITTCYRKGLFDPSLTRGRGAWNDNGNTVLHCGDRLIIDGNPTAIEDYQSDHFYQSAPKINIESKQLLSLTNTTNLVELCESLLWERPEMGMYFAGWLALAPICGALDWRPHAWLVGPSGAGKSWVYANIIQQTLGNMSLNVQSVTTEAGIRQALGHDARPVIFDEAEMDNKQSQTSIQKILELARQASSSDNSKIYKGTPGGQVTSYQVRSMFLLSSIGLGVKRKADQTRVSVLSLRMGTGGKQFKELKELTHKCFTPAQEKFSPMFISRMTRKIPTIKKSIDIYSDVITEKTRSRRTGDQAGSLLGGRWSLLSDEVVSEAQAELDCQHIDFDGNTSEKEEDELLRYIFEQVIKVDDMGNITFKSIGELVNSSFTWERHSKGSKALQRIGVSADPVGVYISTTHSGVKALLDGTPWETNWKIFLRRVNNKYYVADDKTTVKRFAGVSSRAVFLERMNDNA